LNQSRDFDAISLKTASGKKAHYAECKAHFYLYQWVRLANRIDDTLGIFVVL